PGVVGVVLGLPGAAAAAAADAEFAADGEGFADAVELPPLGAESLAPVTVIVSNTLPRIDGSMTICDSVEDTPSPAGPGRATVTVPVHRLATPSFCSASTDHCQSGSSSNDPLADESARAPAMTSLSLDWARRVAWLCCWISMAWSLARVTSRPM